MANRSKFVRSVTLYGKALSGIWPNRFQNVRPHGWRGAKKGKTLRDFRSSKVIG